MAHNFSLLSGRLLRKRIGTAGQILTLAAALSLAGCASVPPPDGAMSQAQAQLQAARDAGAADYDPVDLGFAQDKFQQAQAAMAARKYDIAADLAEEAGADASLARVKARLGAARAQIQSKQDENGRVRMQNDEARTEAEQHARQEQAQLASQQAAAGAGDGSTPAPAGSAPAPLPAQEPVQDLPAPSSSALAPVPEGQGFQTLPEPTQQPTQQPTGGQQP